MVTGRSSAGKAISATGLLFMISLHEAVNDPFKSLGLLKKTPPGWSTRTLDPTSKGDPTCAVSQLFLYPIDFASQSSGRKSFDIPYQTW